MCITQHCTSNERVFCGRCQRPWTPRASAPWSRHSGGRPAKQVGSVEELHDSSAGSRVAPYAVRHKSDWLSCRIDSFTGAATARVDSILALCNRDIDGVASATSRVALPAQRSAQASSSTRSSMDVLAGLLSGSAPAQGPRCAACRPTRAHPPAQIAVGSVRSKQSQAQALLGYALRMSQSGVQRCATA